MTYVDQVPAYRVELPCRHSYRTHTPVVPLDDDENEDFETGTAWLYCRQCVKYYGLEAWELYDQDADGKTVFRTKTNKQTGEVTKRPVPGMYQHAPVNAKGNKVADGQIQQQYDAAVVKDAVASQFKTVFQSLKDRHPEHRDPSMEDLQQELTTLLRVDEPDSAVTVQLRKIGQGVVRQVGFDLGFYTNAGPNVTPLQAEATSEVEGDRESLSERRGFLRLNERPAHTDKSLSTKYQRDTMRQAVSRYVETRKALRSAGNTVRWAASRSNVTRASQASETEQETRTRFERYRREVAEAVAEIEGVKALDVEQDLINEEQLMDNEVTSAKYQSDIDRADRALSSRPHVRPESTAWIATRSGLSGVTKDTDDSTWAQWDSVTQTEATAWGAESDGYMVYPDKLIRLSNEEYNRKVSEILVSDREWEARFAPEVTKKWTLTIRPFAESFNLAERNQ